MTGKTTIQRRRFLAGCLVASGISLLRAPEALAARAVRLGWRDRLFQTSLAMLTKADFEPCRGTTFQMQIAPGHSTPLELIEVAGYPARAMRQGATREPFSLVFRGPRELRVSQQIFPLSHPRLGSQEIFLVPIGPDEEGMRLEAVFT